MRHLWQFSKVIGLWSTIFVILFGSSSELFSKLWFIGRSSCNSISLGIFGAIFTLGEQNLISHQKSVTYPSILYYLQESLHVRCNANVLKPLSAIAYLTSFYCQLGVVKKLNLPRLHKKLLKKLLDFYDGKFISIITPNSPASINRVHNLVSRAFPLGTRLSCPGPSMTQRNIPLAFLLYIVEVCDRIEFRKYTLCLSIQFIEQMSN